MPIDEIGTDRHRLDSYTPGLAANQNSLGAGDWWRFRHFRKTDGYVNMPLDGLWCVLHTYTTALFQHWRTF